MISRTERRLNLFDMMVLVAMAGAGIFSVQDVSLDDSLLTTIRDGLVSPLLGCGLAWTLSVLLLRLRHPRPPRRHLARQPGAVACATAVLVAVAGALALLLVMVERHYTRGAYVALTNAMVPRFLEAMAPYMGVGVLVAWLVLAMNSMWRPEPSWIDRLGRVMGAFWIATIPILVWPPGRLIL
jgi:hypothetical protein